MVSKGYHYVINLGIVGNFYISIDPVYPGSCARGEESPVIHKIFETNSSFHVKAHYRTNSISVFSGDFC